MRIGLLAVLLLAALLSACADDSGPAAKGKQIYLAQCTACHNSDPSKPGPVGPPVKGSSPELLEAKVLRGTYPPAYTPKQDTSLMQPMPHLAANIPDLSAYLR
jgi:mono/diheme cytochrome c family protein